MANLRKIFIVMGLATVTCLFLWLQRTNEVPSQYAAIQVKEIEPTVPIIPKMKSILYWTPTFRDKTFYLGLGEKIFENCTYKNCFTTHQRDSLPIDEFDAIAFHAIEYQERIFGKPSKRNPRQVYIFLNLESPDNTPRFFHDYNDFYNWSMSYRLDSDILRPYGFFEKQETGYQPPSVEEIQERPKKIAWLVSHCGTSSQRERLYDALRKHVPIDVYGSCSNNSCPKGRTEECLDVIEKQYKFYLSFENSICEDYVTEKLYNALKRNVVPIVYGGADYSTLAPPKSVINVMDFNNVTDLVAHIKYLDTHPEEYLKYFEWKKEYLTHRNINKITLCSLCQKLNEPIEPKVYTDLDRWWRGEKSDKCFSGTAIKQFL